jgi:hypothetical protein
MQPESTAFLALTRFFLRPQSIWFTVLALVLGYGALLPQSAFAQTPTKAVCGGAHMDKMSLRDRLLPALFGPTNTTRFPGSSDVPSLNLSLFILYRYCSVCVVTGMFMRLPSYPPRATCVTDEVCGAQANGQ